MPQDAGLPDPSNSPTPPRDPRPVAGRIDGPHLPPRPSGPPGPSGPPAISGPTALAAGPDLMSLLVSLRHRWITAVLLGGTLSVIAAVATFYLLAPKNTAFAQLRVLYIDPALMKNSVSGPIDFKTTLQTTAVEVTGRKVIANALKRDEVKRLHLELTDPDPIQSITEDIRAEFKENSELLTIFYVHSDPVVATTVTNAILTSYLEDVVYYKKAERDSKVTKLEKAYSEGTDQYKTKRKSLNDLAKNMGTDPKFFAEMRMELNNSLRDAKLQKSNVGYKLFEVRAQLDVFEARLKGMSADGAKEPVTPNGKAQRQVELEMFLENDAQVRKLDDELGKIEDDIGLLKKKRYRDTFPPLASLLEQKKKLKKDLEKRQEQLTRRFEKLPQAGAAPGTTLREDPAIVRAQLTKQVESLVALQESLGKDIEKMTAMLVASPANLYEYDQLADEIRRDEESIKELGKTLDREKIELLAASRISRHQDAALMKKDNKKQLLAAAVAPLAVFFTVCIGLAMLEFRKRRVRRASEISRGLGIRVVGAVPRMPHLERHLVMPGGESDLEGTPVMESIDAIRTRLLHEANTRSTRVVLVTSAGPGEGKTTLASALATSLARAGRKTLLLDGDLRRPTVHELFEIPMQPGLSEVLLGEIEMAEAAQESMQDNLSIIPAGQWDREVLLALSRDGLEGIFERLSEEFDFIIVDSHPVLSATDSLLLGRHVDAVILSVLREVSQMPRVYAASQQLAGLGIRVLGAVVNGTDPEEVFSTPPTAVAVA